MLPKSVVRKIEQENRSMAKDRLPEGTAVGLLFKMRCTLIICVLLLALIGSTCVPSVEEVIILETAQN
ncbi:hypothetical protein MAR_007896 [Mya arenaria]|uniref:Uncharacterized protein n=1 Tax=Mya arenaria TaxID=6604 RepID=A0ABY7DUF5_MYAAR|nr:hypothetical protein MAR_007896 [Mya arenaria]